MAKRKWRIPGVVADFIEEMAVTSPLWSASEIYREMLKRFPDVKGLPTERTVQNCVKDCRPPDDSGRWSPTEWSGGDAALVLEVMGAMLTEIEAGSLRLEVPLELTTAQAKRILWVRQVAPQMPVGLVWRVAMLYLIRESREETTAHLDWYLAIKGWDEKCRPVFERMVKKGLIDPRVTSVQLPGVWVSPEAPVYLPGDIIMLKGAYLPDDPYNVAYNKFVKERRSQGPYTDNDIEREFRAWWKKQPPEVQASSHIPRADIYPVERIEEWDMPHTSKPLDEGPDT